MLFSPYRLLRPLLLMLLSLTVVSLAYYVLLLLGASNNLHVYTNPKKNGSKNNVDVRPCSPTTPLGPIPVDTTAVGLNELDEQFPEVTRGGHYVPPNCTSDQVAIIVPYRNHSAASSQPLNFSSPVAPKVTEVEATTQLIARMVEAVKNLSNASSGGGGRNDTPLQYCDEMPPDLGPIPVDTTAVGLNELDEQFPEVTRGGHYVPPNCTSDQVAIIVPYRNHSAASSQPLNFSSPVAPKVTEVEATTQLIARMVEAVKNLSNASSGGGGRNDTPLQYCDEMPPDLGPISVDKSDKKLAEVDSKYPEVYWGGRYSPPNCIPRHKVAIIVPFRDREQHLAIFLNHMHPFLIKQQLDYGIYIVEQEGNGDFNRAKLMNVGFRESMRLTYNSWQCFVFHDIDLLPMDGRNMYSCPRQPRHMSVSVDKYDYKLPYVEIFGGVSALTYEQFTKVNGFSNKYWGWGGEDDDMYYRIKKMNYHVARYKMSIARYTMMDHKKSSPNPQRFQLLSQTTKQFMKDGLTTLKYKVVQVNKKHLYTHILVNIDELS